MAAVPSGAPLALVMALCCLAGTSGQGFAPPSGTGTGQVDNRFSFDLYLVKTMYEENKADLMDGTSALARNLENAIEVAFQGAGGYLDTVSFGNGEPCVVAYVQWVNAATEDLVYEAQKRVEMYGLKEGDQTWAVSFEGCTPDIHVLTFNLYVANLPLTDDMLVKNSAPYMVIKEQVTSAFADLGGQIRTMELADNNGCLHIFVEWEALFPREVVRLTTELKATGLTVLGQLFTVSTKPCLPSDGK